MPMPVTRHSGSPKHSRRANPLEKTTTPPALTPLVSQGTKGHVLCGCADQNAHWPPCSRRWCSSIPQAIRRQSTLFTDMGVAYAQQGNVQEACKLACQALTITMHTKSRAVLERVRTLHRA